MTKQDPYAPPYVVKHHKPDWLDVPAHIIEIACAAYWDYDTHTAVDSLWGCLVAKEDYRVSIQRKKLQAVLSVLIGEGLIQIVPEKKPSGMPSGYSFDITTCPDCGQRIKGNWIVRHRKSGCQKGIFREGVKT